MKDFGKVNFKIYKKEIIYVPRETERDIRNSGGYTSYFQATFG